MTPSKPRSRRSSPETIGALKVAGPGAGIERRHLDVRDHHRRRRRRRCRRETAPARRGRAGPDRAAPWPGRGACRSPVSPCPGKCFSVATTPPACRPVDRGPHHRADAPGIFAERADVDHRVARVVVHVGHRREVHVHAEGAGLAARRCCAASRTSSGSPAAPKAMARGKRRAAVDAHADAVLEVGGDQQRHRRQRPAAG